MVSFLIILLLAAPQKTELSPEASPWFQKGEALIGTPQAFSEEQASHFRKTLEIQPDFDPAIYNLALIYLAQQKLDEAILQLDHFLRLRDEDVQGYRLRAEAHLKRGNLESAQNDIEVLVRRAPEHFATWQHSGRLHYQRGETEQALRDLRRALQLSPDNVDIHLDLGLTLDRAGRASESETHYRAFHTQQPADWLSNYLLGRNLLMQEDFSSSLPYLEKAFSLQPDHRDIRDDLTRVYLGLEDFQKAEQHLLKGDETASNLGNLGMITHQQERLQEAETYYQKAVLLDPDNRQLHLRLGDLFAESQRPEQALQSYQKAVALGVSDFDTLLRIGQLQANTKDLEGAAKTLAQALEKNPESGSAHYVMGVVQDRLESPGRAMSHYQEAVQRGVRQSLLHFRLGVLLSKEGKVEPSIDQFEMALQMDHATYLPLLSTELQKVTSDLDAVRYQPRFAALLKKYQPAQPIGTPQ